MVQNRTSENIAASAAIEERPSAGMEQSLKQEQLKILFSHRRAISIGGVLVALLTTAILWSISNRFGVLVWLSSSVAVASLRYWIAHAYLALPEQQQDSQCERASRQYTILSVLNGFVWGSVPVLFFPEEPHYIALLIGLHACYVAAAAASTSIHLPTFYGFIVPSTCLYFLAFVIAGWTYWAHALLILLYLLTCYILGRRNNASLTEQILLRFKNTELLAQLVGERDKAQNAMLGKNRFLAAASHDLRQPVHALGLFLDSLEGQPQTDASKNILGKIRQSTAALSALFHGLLDISKLDANVVENVPDHLCIDSLFSLLKTDFQGVAMEKGLELRIPVDTHAAVYADIGLLERILRNLIGNAINYTPEGSVEVTVTAGAQGKLDIAVSDTGKGIPESEIDNIFSEYHQLENPERDRQKGLGLGLAIVQRLCLLMDVPITVQSRVGHGSVFTLSIAEGYADEEVTMPTRRPQIDLREKRVIVIDDEKDILDGMQSVLSTWGCRTTTAESVSDAQSQLERFGQPDVIIADFRLRNNESGLDAIELIRDEFNTDIPAILVTGDTSPERLQQASSASVELLHKPVEPSRLRMAIVQLVV